MGQGFEAASARAHHAQIALENGAKCHPQAMEQGEKAQGQEGVEAVKLISRKDARALGLKRYFTGKACLRGHMGERQVLNAGCLDCQAERLRRSRRQNHAHVLDMERKYKNRNRERIQRNHAKYRNKNRERIRRQQARLKKQAAKALKVCRLLGIEIEI
jgi:hypothetical protein